MAALNFNAATVAPTTTYQPVPKGDYLVMIVASDMKPTRSGGQYLELELEIMDGNFKGRKLWDRLNLINPNPKTVDIAQRQLSSLCHAANRLNVSDSAELHNIPVIAQVVYNEPQGTYGASNGVRAYMAVTPQPPANQQSYVAPAPVVQQQDAAPASVAQTPHRGATPPWAKKA